MSPITFLCRLFLLKMVMVVASSVTESFAAEALRPNIVYILADDLGYGDIQALNPMRGKIATPHLDRMAERGMVFTDAHSPSSVCTPTRYGILTGRYAWRTHLQSGVLYGESPPLIAAECMTVPRLLQSHGYATYGVGKWHLGLDWQQKTKEKFTAQEKEQAWDIDYSIPFGNGPVTRGFDHFFGISASLDMPPYVYLRGDRATKIPMTHRTYIRKGAAAEDFEAEDVLPAFTREAIQVVDQCAEKAKSGSPFFLYWSLASPHTPIVPTSPWKGKSGLGDYGDFVMQTDAAVGELLAALKRNGLEENTLVIFTSDNGCSPAANTANLEKQGHFASGDRRGYKADIYDGGHRVPLLIQWPSQVKAGSRSNQLVGLNDLMATCGELLQAKLPDEAGVDSVSFLGELLGNSNSPGRESLVHHSIQGKFAFRKGKWKLVLCAGSGGWSQPNDAQALKQDLPPFQLFDMEKDVAETTNLIAKYPEIAKALEEELASLVANGRSTPGAAQSNDVEVKIRK